MPSPRQRRQRSRRKEEQPPGRYISIAVLVLSALSLLGAVAAPFLPFSGGMGVSVAVSGLASAVVLAAVWAALKNLRELNHVLNDKYGSSNEE